MDDSEYFSYGNIKLERGKFDSPTGKNKIANEVQNFRLKYNLRQSGNLLSLHNPFRRTKSHMVGKV
ncbi:MAG: hypothetical protein V3V33_07060 [Candidatus Lokiarchaeia archaeon]